MRRRVREVLRRKLGAAMQEYVTDPLLARMTADLEATRRALHEQRRAVEEAKDELARAMHAWERRQRRDLLTVGDVEAARSSAAFCRARLDRATAYFAKHDLLAAALDAATIDGVFLEFGVATGGTLRQITAHAPEASCYGFDSFDGLPEHWRMGFGAGAFATEGLPDVPGAEFVVGWFDQTLPGFLDREPRDVAFLHLDADLYSSTVTVLAALVGRLRPGTVVVFDEYFNYPGWEDHEHKAWEEFVARHDVEFEYLGFTADDEQVSVRILSVGTPVGPA
ncbi:Macrocin-O-methyltransferase (TylF) [Klenkia soli]|uniref:Macrocin-O-methyltransferase (TylF) n=1 Tax=Klenkia soli TaxID=1052260 RepID=A0A1H0INH2_9ACTN|nr:class I SAM-dependent methyltransferase [Klenkia soli]SDO32915.1 Macrocin-O-methyltransferase (TylF) [Klenkia soli]